MPYEGIKFGTVAVMEWAFPKTNAREGRKNDSIVGDVTRKLMFGGAGGVSASVITYPNDTFGDSYTVAG